MSVQQITSGMQVDGQSIAIAANNIISIPVAIAAPNVPASPTVITGNFTTSSANVGQNLQNTGSSALNVTLAAGTGNLQVSQFSSGTVSVLGSPENLLTYSEDFGQGYWTKTACSVTATGVTDPISGTAARAITTSSASVSSLTVASALTVPTQPANSAYRIGVWLQGVGSSIGARVNVGSGTQWYALILTSGWQQVLVTAIPTTTQSLFINFADANTIPANVPNAAVVNVYGAWLHKPAGKAYVTTAGSTVTGTYNLTGATKTTSTAAPFINVIERTSGNFYCYTPLDLSPGSDSTFASFKSAPRPPMTIVISAFNTLNSNGSDYICTGVNDNLVISAAITSLAYTGGTILLRAGLYILNGAIIHDASHVSLVGECRGFWQRTTGSAYPSIAYEGVPGGVQLLQTLSGANGITCQQNNLADNQSNRHTGIAFKNLYFYAANGNGNGLVDFSNTDISEVTDCVFHNFAIGLYLGWDTPFVSGNSFQSLTSHAFVKANVFGTVMKNIMYDIGGACLYVNQTGAGGGQFLGNTMGSCSTNAFSAVILNGGWNVFIGNVIQGVNTPNHAIELSGSTCINNIISNNVISLDNRVGIATSSNHAGNGIFVHNSSLNNTIENNQINQSTSGTNTGYAVALGVSGTDTTATGNLVTGNNVTGTWNSNAQPKIADFSTGTTNMVLNNLGAVEPATIPTVVSGSTSGTASFSMSTNKTYEKKVVIYLAALLGTASYTFPTAFTQTPAIVTTDEVGAGVVTSKSTTALTLTGVTTTGFLFIQGY